MSDEPGMANSSNLDCFISLTSISVRMYHSISCSQITQELSYQVHTAAGDGNGNCQKIRHNIDNEKRYQFNASQWNSDGLSACSSLEVWSNTKHEQ
jgi:hypothetical protein